MNRKIPKHLIRKPTIPAQDKVSNSSQMEGVEETVSYTPAHVLDTAAPYHADTNPVAPYSAAPAPAAPDVSLRRVSTPFGTSDPYIPEAHSPRSKKI